MFNKKLSLRKSLPCLVSLMLLSNTALAHPAGYYDDAWGFVVIYLIIFFVIGASVCLFIILIVAIMIGIFYTKRNKQTLLECFKQLVREKLEQSDPDLEQSDLEKNRITAEGEKENITDKTENSALNFDNLSEAINRANNTDYVDNHLFFILAEDKIKTLECEIDKIKKANPHVANLKNEQFINHRQQVNLLKNLIFSVKFKSRWLPILVAILIVLMISILIISALFL
ncbi:MAG: hypothetical protein MJ060_04125 [Clostridia bacterium]|nr:hypothetical protein [Clostridia bacterium]